VELSTEIMSDIITHMKYAKYLPEEHRRETFEEIVTRNKEMHIRKFPHLKNEIDEAYELVYQKKILPSMRSLQFAGKAVEVNNLRLYNCSFLPMDDSKAFSELAFLLLSGVGVGLSVQKHHVRKLPVVLGAQVPTGKQHKKRFLISDDIEGWADAIKVLVESHFYGEREIDFDPRAIREKGMPLRTSGGKAPGPAPLMTCLVNVNNVFKNAVTTRGIGTQLQPIEVFDICCFIADMVLAGGQRRAALSTLFSLDDNAMLESKFGNWWENNPQRGRSNNSAVLLRSQITKEVFDGLWKKIEASGSGEPGIMFSDSADYGCNPSLRAGTKVWTDEGIFPIEELEGKKFTVKNINGELSNAKCWKSGVDKQLFSIKLRGGQEYFATPQHEWPVWFGSGFVKVRSDALKPGMFLRIIKSDTISNGVMGTYNDGFLTGWQIGDGWTTVRGDNGALQQGIVVSKKDNVAELLLKILSEKGINVNFIDRGTTLELNTVNKNWDSFLAEFGYNGKDKLPDAVWNGASEEYIKGMIDGLFSSDGSVECASSEKRISFFSSRESLVKDLKELLGFYGIKTSIYLPKKRGFKKGDDKVFQQYVLRITENESLMHFKKLFKLSVKHKQDRLDEYVIKHHFKGADLIEICDVGLSDVHEDVWDISVQDTSHAFQLSGAITGNCFEISLQCNELCNLVEIDSSKITSQDDLEYCSRMAARIATIQATYTDFHYLREVWRDTVEKEALIGVSLTGIASGAVTKLDMSAGAEKVIEENRVMAKKLGINPSARSTCVKPSGTASLLLGTSSGVHAWYAPYYWRRVSVWKEEPIYAYLRDNHPELLEDDYFKPTTMAKIKVPMKAPEGAALRYESALSTLERVKLLQNTWIAKGHVSGINKNNVSTTISVRPEEWAEVGEWMWENRSIYTGIAVLPYDGGTYTQSPFEECTKEEYEEAVKYLTDIDLRDVYEGNDNTSLQGEAACAGGACEIK